MLYDDPEFRETDEEKQTDDFSLSHRTSRSFCQAINSLPLQGGHKNDEYLVIEIPAPTGDCGASTS